MFLRKTLPILLFIFLLSVLVRFPFLQNPLTYQNENLTATTLVILSVWNTDGLEERYSLPSLTYSKPNDKNAFSFDDKHGFLKDKNGNYYHISYPPFSYYLAYSFYKIFPLEINEITLRYFSLFFHFLSGVFIYLIVCLLSYNKPQRDSIHLSGLVAFCVYIFNPAAMWYQGFVYHPDILVQCEYVALTYVTLKMIIRTRYRSFKYLFWFSFVNFLMVYTSWIGVLFSFTIIVYGIISMRKNYRFLPVIFLTVFTSGLAILFMILQYTQIAGIKAYLYEISKTLFAQGFTSHKGLLSFKDVLYNYLNSYLIFYLFLIAFFLLAFLGPKMRVVFTKNGYRYMLLSGLPIVLFHIILLRYSSLEFTVLYGSIFLCVTIGILYDKIKLSKMMSITTSRILVVSMLFGLIAQFFYKTYHQEKIPFVSNMTRLSALEHRSEKIVFSENTFVYNTALFYAKRNIELISKKEYTEPVIRLDKDYTYTTIK